MAGRPLGFDRDTALAAAIEQFWRTGFAETTISMLTKAMGVTPPSLYAAFGDKNRLFEEAAQNYFQRTCEALDRFAGERTAREAIAQMLNGTARAHTDTQTPPGCLMLSEPRLTKQREDLVVGSGTDSTEASARATSHQTHQPTSWQPSWWR